MKKILLLVAFCLLVTSPVLAESDKSPLAPLMTDNPRDTMYSYMEAMKDYKKGYQTNNETLIARLDDAVRCFNLEDVPVMSRQQVGREAAIFLKEVIDRIIVINYDKIPEKSDDPEEPLKRWRLKDTEIVIARVESGERAGEYLFSSDTTLRVPDFYEKVKHLPYKMGSGGGAGYKESWWQSSLPAWSENEFLSLAYWQWAGIFLSILVGLIVRLIARRLTRLVLLLTSKTEFKWDDRLVDAAAPAVGLLAATGIWYASLHILRLKGMALTLLAVVVQILLFTALTWMAYRLMGVLAEYLSSLTSRTEDMLDDQLVNLIGRALKIFIVILGVLLAAQNLGIDVLSLIAGLGIGGLAVALAAKDSLANFFGSVMIMLDRPFQVGHWVIVGGAEGTVEDIGFRSTKIRTFHNSLISVPNSTIATSKIDNMGLREYRRVYQNIGVAYDTPPEKIEAFLEGIKNIIKANAYTRKDYYHVVFTSFEASSLNIMLYFFLRVDDWSIELVEKQNVFLEIVRLADALGVEFAFPTQTLHVASFPEKEPLNVPKLMENQDMAETAKEFGKDGKAAKPGGSGLFVPPFKEPVD